MIVSLSPSEIMRQGLTPRDFLSLRPQRQRMIAVDILRARPNPNQAAITLAAINNPTLEFRVEYPPQK